MALVTGKLTFTTSWTQTKTHTGSAPAFASSKQDGPVTTTVSPTISAAACNRVYFVQGTLAAGATVTINVFSLTEPAFGEAIVPVRAYSIHYKGATTTSRVDPVNGSNPLTWFFGAATDQINLNAGDSFMYASATAFTVSNTVKNIRVTNTAGAGTLTYTVILLLGV